MLRRYALITSLLVIASVRLSTPLVVGSAQTEQAAILVDASDVTGTIRSLQGINAGPRGDDRQSHLFRQYEDIGVDYVRTHDYYGPADMHVLFPNLQADPDDESNYDFTSTDRELEAIMRVGAEVLFRLGESWGSPVTYMAPQDHQAWAQAAVHVAKHYNDGWANGFHWDIEYWEVWNEPDITQFWIGMPEEYYQLYEAVARALKAYDPTLKVGGPGLCCSNDFLKDFLAYCRDHDVPLDFVSWHIYDGDASPYVVAQRAEHVQLGLDTYGFTDAENLLTEWNIAVWSDYEHLRDATGAAWTVSALAYLQDSTVTIANRYRGDGGLGMFTSEGFYTKPAYGFLAFKRLLETPHRLSASGSDMAGYAVLAGRVSGETSEVCETSEVWSPMVQILISDYDSNHTGFSLTVNNLPWGAGQPYHYERYLLDETHDLTLVESANVPAGSSSFTTTEAMAAPSVQLIRLFIPAGEMMPQITIRADQTLDPISPLLYGLNHRYLYSGYGVWDAEAQQVHPEVITRSLEIGFPVARFPGGSVGSTYHWTDGIGSPEERPTGISGFDGAPASNEYGFDEHMLFMEQVGATANVVVNFGIGTAQEAAAWVAYANGDPADTMPIGVDELGVDWGTVREWATRREANQMRLGMSPHPYNIRYWEVGNELYGDWEYSWTHGAIKYATGGTAWQYDQRVVKEDDWRDSVSRSNGQPSQIFYLRYPPVVTGTQTITVSGVAWAEVPDLSATGPDDAVYEFDPQSGEIRFGDGEHGRIPPLAAPIRASYESGPHDGFVDYYAAMKAVDPDIKVGSCFYTDVFLQTMGEEHPYDFLAVHPYYSSGGRGGNGLAEAHLRTMAGPLIRQMDLEDLQAGVRLYAWERAAQVEIAITEHNLFVPERYSPTPHYGMSLDQGLFVADMLRVMIEGGISLGDLHCLIDTQQGEGWDNTAVMNPYPELIPRPAAYVLQLFNQHFAPVRVESEVKDAPLLTGSMPALEVVASTDEAGERLTLLAINKDASTPITATVAVGGFTPASEATVWALTGPDIAAFNDRGHPTDVSITESAIANAGQSFVYAFPPHSVTLIELVANSSHPTPTPTATPTCMATPTSTPTPTPTATRRSRLYLPLILKTYTPTRPTATFHVPSLTFTPTPTATWNNMEPGTSTVASANASPPGTASQTWIPTTQSITNPPYPRLGILTWYSPRNFAAELSDKTGSQVTLNDPNRTALLDFLAARQLVVVTAGDYLGNSAAVQADRNRLAQARTGAGFRLLGIWGSSGSEPYNLTFMDTTPSSSWPFVPEWFVQEIVRPLPTAVHVGETVLPIDSSDLGVYCLKRNTGYDNDQVIITDTDPVKQEAVVLKCSTWDHASTTIHLTTSENLRPPQSAYDFGAFKYDHAAGTPVRLNLWHSWGNWWGYNMTDVGPVYRGQRWNEYRPRIIHSQFKQIRDGQGQLLFDGVLLDTFNQEWFGPYSSAEAVVKRLDLDADGESDWQEQRAGMPEHDPTGCFPDYWTGQPNWDNCAWATGHTTFARNLRALWDADPELNPDHAILMQHEFGENATYLNGQSFENIPYLELSADMNANRWQTAFEHYQYWEQKGRPPQVIFIFTNCSHLPDSEEYYAQMRLALAFTLMGSGHFMHSPFYPDISAFNGDALWWFDEYAVDSHGRAIDVYATPALHPLVNIRTDLLEQMQFAATVRPGLGYLGYPVTEPITLTKGVYRHDFERGIVLANFSPVTVTLSLERPYRKILGVQDPQTNDGSLVTGVVLGAQDALILLDPAAFNGTPTPTPTATASPMSTLTATATASPTSTPTVTFLVPSPTFTSTPTPGHCLYLPLVLKAFPVPDSTPTPTVTVTPSPTPFAIVLAERAGGLELVAAPVTLSLTVGHVAYLPIEVQNYHRPITISAQTLIYTYVNDLTPAEPGDSLPFDVGTLDGPRNELQLQTLRLRPHFLTLTFQTRRVSENPSGLDGLMVSTTLTLEPVIQPRTSLFGVHSTPFYDGLPAPFIRVWGPDCGSCPTTPGDPPGSTRDIGCAKALNDTCRCHPFQEVFDSETNARVRERAPEQQRYASHFVRSIGGWGSIQHQPGQYLWQGLDWLFDDLSPQERDYSPLFSGIMDGNFGWMTCPEYTNPDGSVGFFDPDNTYLVEQYRAHIRATTERYAPDLRFVELSNEPAAEYYLCPCVAPGGTCNATTGPNQPACLLGPNSPEFVATYGDLLFTAADAAAEEMAIANPDALEITGALDLPPNDFGLSLTTAYMITRSLLTHDNVAIGIHQYPYLNSPNWISPTLNCAYYQVPGDPYWLPSGCETAPPFEDYVTPAGRPIPARYTWQQFDERVDVSNLLHDADSLGVLDRIYFFDTELHAGWHDGDPTTTPAREAMAGLRIGSINAHQRVLGSEFIFAPTDPTAYNLLVKHLAGATPVYAWDAPLMDADYSGLVYKLFTRPVGQVPGTSEVPGTLIGEDIIALWSNAEEYQQVVLTFAAEPTQFKQVTLTSFGAVLPCADEQERLAIFTENKSAPPESVLVQPLKQFYFLSVISDQSGFGWLAGLRGEVGSMEDDTPSGLVTIDVDLPSSSTGSPTGTLAVRVHTPMHGHARYPEGAPVPSGGRAASR